MIAWAIHFLIWFQETSSPVDDTGAVTDPGLTVVKDQNRKLTHFYKKKTLYQEINKYMSKIFKHLNNLETEFKKKKRVLGGTIL